MPSASAASARRSRGVSLDILFNFGKLVVEMLQCGQQDFPVAWIVSGFKIMNNTSAREEEAFALLDSFRFQGVQSYATAGGSPGFCQFDLRLDRLAFPTSSHN